VTKKSVAKMLLKKKEKNIKNVISGTGLYGILVPSVISLILDSALNIFPHDTAKNSA
jgi:hypothetical protein